MKKFKFMFIIFVFMFILCGILTSIYALGDGFDSETYNILQGGNVDKNISNSASRVYGTILTVFQVIAAFGVVFTGIKYMTAGANEKGEIKQTIIYIIIGCILVFATTSFIKFIIRAGNEFSNDVKSEYNFYMVNEIYNNIKINNGYYMY